jgi:uncharacterized membrane protein YdjX (TVP38/TMEM64 family)
LRAVVAVVVAVVLVLGLVLLWRLTPLSSLNAPALVHDLLTGAAGPFVGVGVVVVGGLVFFPLTLLILQAGLVFPPFTAVVVSVLGAVLSSLLSYGIGWCVGPRVLTRVFGRQLLRTAARLDTRGVWATAGLRLLPVSPFTLVNLAAGAAHVRLAAFLAGTALGLLPAVFALTLIGHALGSVVNGRWRIEIAVIVVVAGLVASGVAALLIRHRHTMALAQASS